MGLFRKFRVGGVGSGLTFCVVRVAIRGLLRGFGASMFIKRGKRLIERWMLFREMEESTHVATFAGWRD